MDKIRYILALNNIRISDSVKARILNDIHKNAAEEKKPLSKKKLRPFIIAAASVLLVLAVIVTAAVITRKDPDGPQSTDTVSPGSDSADETGTIETVPQDIGLFTVVPLYANDDMYSLFLETTKYILPCKNGFLLSDNWSEILTFFNTGAASANDVCDTMFAFYSGTDRVFTKNYAAAYAEYEDDGALELIENAAMLEKKGIHQRQIPVLTCRHGTFEYLLVMTVFEENLAGSGDRTLYDRYGEVTGWYSGGSFTFYRDGIVKTECALYKIRVENGVPVIYGKSDVKLKIKLSSEQSSFSSPLGYLTFDAPGNSEYAYLSSADLVVDGRWINLVCDEGTDIRSFNGSEKANSVLSTYHFKTGFEPGSGYDRKTLCRIINELDLQWFFPMYKRESGNGGVTIIGAGIKKKGLQLRADSALSSVLYPYISSDMSDVHYASYAPSDITDEGRSIYLHYDPTGSDIPYFQANSADLPIFEVYIDGNTGDVTPKNITVAQLGALVQGEAVKDNAFEFYYTDLYENKTVPDERSSVYPFSADLAPLMIGADSVISSVSGAPVLREGLYDELSALLDTELKMPDPGVIKNRGKIFGSLFVGLGERRHRVTAYSLEEDIIYYSDSDNIRVTAYPVDEDIIYYSDNIGDIRSWTLTISEGVSLYDADPDGLIYAIRANGYRYCFDNTDPDTLSVITKDGVLLYVGPSLRKPLDTDGTGRYRYEEIRDGMMIGTYVFINRIILPHMPVSEVSFDEDGSTVTVYGSDNAASGVTFPIKRGGNVRYYYYRDGSVKHVGADGVVYWDDIPSDDTKITYGFKDGSVNILFLYGVTEESGISTADITAEEA